MNNFKPSAQWVQNVFKVVSTISWNIFKVRLDKYHESSGISAWIICLRLWHVCVATWYFDLSIGGHLTNRNVKWPSYMNVSTTPLWQWGFRQCLPFNWTTLRAKHCQHSIAVMGVADKLIKNNCCLEPLIVLQLYSNSKHRIRIFIDPYQEYRMYYNYEHRCALF